MNKIALRARAALLLLFVFCIGLITFYISFGVNGSKWALSRYNRHLIQSGKGTITDSSDTILTGTQGEFNESAAVRKSLLHLLGDYEGFITNGIQKAYAPELYGYGAINGIHMIKEWEAVPDVKLTINSGLNKVAAEQLGARKGAICVYNYKTGEVLCITSTPSFDPQQKPSSGLDIEAYEGLYVNRVLNGQYPPGSIFKLVTSIAAIENIPDIYTRKFTCEGKFKTDGGEIICHATHGTISFEKALSESCNCVFAQLAIELGGERLKKSAEKAGFNSNGKLDRLEYNGGKYAAGSDQAELGWSGVGQGKDLASPFNMMLLAGSIANGGVQITPKVVGSVTNPFGIPSILNLSFNKRIISESTATSLTNMMKSAAGYSFGKDFFNKYGLCAKTGTAEVEKGKPHSWLVGFLQDEANPYAFVILLENAGTAAYSTKPVVSALIRELTK